jgi:hypothetical protein
MGLYLLVVLRLRLAGKVFTCIIAVDNVFHKISEIQNLQHSLRVLMCSAREHQ